MGKFVKFALISSFFISAACQHVTERRTAGENPSDLSQKIVCPSKTRREITGYTPPADGLVKVAFFDADSTLRIAPSGSVSANTPTDVRILPNVPKVLKMLRDKGYLIYIVSNQSGVSAGHVTCDTAEGALLYTISEITKAGGYVHGYDFAENSDENRKPATGMAQALEESLKRTYGVKFHIDKTQSFMVGDSAFKKADNKSPADYKMDFSKLTIVQGQHFSNADRMFAQNYGVHFYEPTDFFGWRKYGIDVLTDNTQVDLFLQKCKDCQ
jgi:D-glycero-D-manno-heptose 1,7-bisphosphate phosphatase